MKTHCSRYIRHRFPAEVISYAVWLYYRFSLSVREVEEMLVERGVDVTYETIRQWSIKFGAQYARHLKRRQGRLGDTWNLDELFVTINGQRQYLWRAVDQAGDILVQPRRGACSATILSETLEESAPRTITSDHRQAGQLPSGSSNRHAFGEA